MNYNLVFEIIIFVSIITSLISIMIVLLKIKKLKYQYNSQIDKINLQFKKRSLEQNRLNDRVLLSDKLNASMLNKYYTLFQKLIKQITRIKDEN